ncbi:unnamed protein product [Lymnaea stagnalis]|uniref:Transmembrane protein 143 n=1 Tax=Lymnaea stagnalis TaxID=6523 RepID=A0AAV2IKM8_LYMST
MAASLVCRKLGTKCHPVLKFTSFEPRGLRFLTLKTERQLLSTSLVACRNFQIALCFSTTSKFRSENVQSKLATTSTQGNGVGKGSESKSQLQLAENGDLYRERYIPITRQSIIRHLLQEKNFFADSELKTFSTFVIALDSALVNKYHTILQELKVLFDPINPDKDTVKVREWTRSEKLDNEFYLLQQLEDVMNKANFHELPKAKVEHFLKEHQAQEGVRVSVDPSRYDVLRFWVLGHERPELQLSLSERILNKILRRPPRPPMEYYKRVVLALRLKKDSKLILKAFKEVPVESLEMLLPDGKIQMSSLDKTLLVTSGSIAGFGVLAKVVTVLASLHVDWTLALTLVTGSIGFRIWSSYKNRRNAYLLDVSRTLYFKNIANNKGLLTLLVDRAEDESLKEAILTYAFLLNSYPMALREEKEFSSSEGGLTKKSLEEQIEKWVEQKTGVKLEFNSSEAILILKNLGLLSEKNQKLQVLTLDSAVRILPQSPPSVIARRAAESDITEGYDRDEYLETEEEYKAEEKKASRYGWF